MTRRPGATTVAELLLVFWLYALVLAALARFLADHAGLAAGQRDLVRLREAARTAEVVLGTELRWLASADVNAGSPAAFAVRAVRGGGPACSVAAEELGVRYRGGRWPEPRKDSLLFVHRGGEAVRAVTGVSVGGCGGAGLLIGIDAPIAARGGLALVFEPGSYHAAAGAIRYRLGAAGRQPITEAIFRSAAFAPGQGAAGLRFTASVDRDSLPRAAAAVSLGLPSLNPGRAW